MTSIRSNSKLAKELNWISCPDPHPTSCVPYTERSLLLSREALRHELIHQSDSPCKIGPLGSLSSFLPHSWLDTSPLCNVEHVSVIRGSAFWFWF